MSKTIVLPETHGSVVLIDPDDTNDAISAYVFDSTHGMWFGAGDGAVSTRLLVNRSKRYGYEILKAVSK